MNQQTTIGKIIRGMRKGKDFTLTELSSRCKVSVSYLSEIERDKANPTVGMLAEIFNELGHSISFHFKERGDDSLRD